MNNFLIMYTFTGIETRYTALFNFLKSSSYWARPFPGVWIIKATLSAQQIRDGVKSRMLPQDKILVVELPAKPGWGTMGIDKRVTDWMKNNL